MIGTIITVTAAAVATAVATTAATAAATTLSHHQHTHGTADTPLTVRTIRNPAWTFLALFEKAASR
jgi:hypothetical protein